ncbi:hypothetical protein AAC387_Pa01g2167 [Persea americana]
MIGPEETLQVKNLPNWVILKTRSVHEKAMHSKPCGTTAPPQSPIAPFVDPLPVSELSAIIPSLSPGHSSSLHSARSTFPLHLLLATPPGPAAIPSPAATPSHCDSLRPLFPLQPKPASPLPSSALDQFPLLAQSPAISSSSVLAVNCCFHSQRPPFSLPAQSHSQQPFSFPALSPRSLISLHSVRPDFSLHSQRLAPVASCFSLLLFFLFRLQIHLHRLPPVAAPPLSPTCEPPAAIPPALQPLALSCLWQPSTCTT